MASDTRTAAETSSRPDRGLNRVLAATAVALVVITAAFTAFYLLDQRSDAGPTRAEQQVAAAEEAVVADPNEVGPRLVLAEAYRAANRHDDALAQYDEVLAAEPASRAALLGRAHILLDRGDDAGAAQAFRAVTDAAVDGEFAGQDIQLQEAHYYLGQIAARGGDPTAAAAELEAALAIEPTDADAWYLLGTARLDGGDPQRAVDALRRAVAFVPSGWCEPYAGLVEAFEATAQVPQRDHAAAMVDLCQGRTDAARQRLESLTSGPVAVDALLGLGMVAESESQRDAAIGYYRRVLERDPASFAAITALSRLGVGPADGPEGSEDR